MRNRLYRFGKFQLTSGTRELRREGGRVPLARRAFDCILYLIEHRDRAVGRDELTAAVWGRVDVTDAQLSQVMLQARRAIDDSGQAQTAVRTLPGFGYRWIAETHEQPDNGGPTEPAPISEASEPGIAAAATDDAAPAPDDDASPATLPLKPESAPARRGRFAAAAAIAAVLVVALAASLLMGRRAPVANPAVETATTPSALAVLPLEVSGPRDSGWIRLGAMDLIAERLRNAGLAVPPSENVLVALRGAPADGKGTHRLGGNLGVGTLVEGKAIQSAEGWTIELAAARGDTQHYTATAKHADVIRAARQAADLLLAAMGHAPPAERGERDALDERLQQAQAARLAGELDTARTILAAIPQQDEPQVRLAQALVDARSGQLERAEASYTALVADPAVQADSTLLGRALSYRGAVHFRRGEFAAAERDFDAATNALHDANATDLARAVGGRGLARTALRRFDDAAIDLGRARAELQRSGDRLGLIQSDMNFGLLEIRRNRPERALPHLLKAADEFEAFGAIERMLAALINAFDAEVALLHWPEALKITERQWVLRGRVGDPGLQLLVAVARGTALAALGRLHEAQRLADDGEREPDYAQNRERARLQALRTEIAWRSGRAAEAAAAAERALAQWQQPYDPGDEQYARLLLLRQRALVAIGKPAAIPPDLDGLPDAAEALPALLLARAENAAQQGRSAEAESRFRAALAKAEANGIPIDLALAAEAYGRWLLAQARTDEAAALAGRIAPWAERDFDATLFQAAVFAARGDRREADAALQRARALAGQREVPDEPQAVASK